MSSTTELSEEAVLHHRDAVIGQMQFAREYTHRLIADIPHDLWYRFPTGSPSNIAWQVGHLAVSQYGLMLFRQRGRAEGDLELMPGWLRKQYGRAQPLSRNRRLTQLLLNSLRFSIGYTNNRSMKQANLLQQRFRNLPKCPMRYNPMKLGALLFAPIHESIHAGQIGLLRRLLGLPRSGNWIDILARFLGGSDLRKRVDCRTLG